MDDDPSLSMKALATELEISGLTVSKAWQETHPGEKRRPQPYRQQRMNRHEEIVTPRGITVFSRPEPDQTPGFTENFNFSPN